MRGLESRLDESPPTEEPASNLLVGETLLAETETGPTGQAAATAVRACPRREPMREPDAGNRHVRFDEGGVGRTLLRVACSPTLHHC